MNVAAIVVAAGRGVRMGTELPKVFLPLAGTPILVRTLRALANVPSIRQIVVAVGREYQGRAREMCNRAEPLPVPLAFAVGGAERQDSVQAGLSMIDDEPDLVIVHDGVRPFVPLVCVMAAIEAAEAHGAALLALPSRDTAKIVDENALVTSTPARETVWLAQTPQVFRTALLRAAHEQARRDGVSATDDAALVERMGVPVRVVRGDAANVKITTPDDLQWAEWYLQTHPALR